MKRYQIGKPLPSQKGKLNVSGRGFISNARELPQKLINMIPASDENARHGFTGERHGIVKLPSGRVGVANYMGPGTHLLERLRRGDPPRSAVDRVAQRHDIDYFQAAEAPSKEAQRGLIRQADERMVAKVQSISNNKLDSKFNITQANLIKPKIFAEKVGILSRDQFSGPLTQNNEADNNLLESTKDALAQEGYGKILPADMLKLALLKEYGVGKPPVGESKSLTGKKAIAKLLNKSFVPLLMTELEIHDTKLKTPIRRIIKGTLAKSSEELPNIISNVAKALMGLFSKLKGSPPVGKTELTKILSVLLVQALSGKGHDLMTGSGFFSEFVNGFKKGFFSTLEVAGGILPGVGGVIAPIVGTLGKKIPDIH